MPHPTRPSIRDWVATLRQVAGKIDENTILVGHSVGCQTILRYLMGLPAGQNVGGVVLVAGWLTLTPEAIPDAFYRRTARPWLTQPLNWRKIKQRGQRFITVYSIDDQYVPASNAKRLQKHLGGRVVKTRGGHLLADDGVKKLPIVLNAVLKLAS